MVILPLFYRNYFDLTTAIYFEYSQSSINTSVRVRIQPNLFRIQELLERKVIWIHHLILRKLATRIAYPCPISHGLGL